MTKTVKTHIKLYLIFSAIFYTFLFQSQSFASEPVKNSVKNIVILSGTFGSGHNTSAESTKKMLEEMYNFDDQTRVNVKILYAEDYVKIGPYEKEIPAGVLLNNKPIKLNKLASDGFNKVYQYTPELYNNVFQHTMKNSREVEARGGSAEDIETPFFSMDGLAKDINDFNTDLIYSTHHISTILALKLEKNQKINPDLKIGWIDTDFVHEPFFYLISKAKNVTTFLAHPFLKDERIKKGVPDEKMIVTGLPINKSVFVPFTEEQRRDFLQSFVKIPDRKKDLNENKPDAEKIWINGFYQEINSPNQPRKLTADRSVKTITIASGGAGLGDFPTIFKSLVEEANKNNTKIQIAAICGDNTANYKGLEKMYKKLIRSGQITVGPNRNVTLSIHKKMDNDKLIGMFKSSDVFIGKSGSQTPIEVASISASTEQGIIPVLLDILGGQEAWTARFMRDSNIAKVVNKADQKNIGRIVFNLLNGRDPEWLEKMKDVHRVTRDSNKVGALLEYADNVLTEQDPSFPTLLKISENRNNSLNEANMINKDNVSLTEKVKINSSKESFSNQCLHHY